MKTFDKLILIDDDPIFSALTREIIEDSNLFKGNLINYLNGARALRDFEETDLKEQRILFLVDINMPIVDGWDFLHEISNANLNAASEIYVVSSSINPTDKSKALAFKLVKDYLPKPFDAYQLSKILEPKLV